MHSMAQVKTSTSVDKDYRKEHEDVYRNLKFPGKVVSSLDLMIY